MFNRICSENLAAFNYKLALLNGYQDALNPLISQTTDLPCCCSD